MASAFQPGRLVDDRYTLESALRGPGIGEVWKAVDTHHAGRQVRIKFLRPQPGVGDEEFVAFARSLQPLRHPNVLAVVDQGVWNQRPYEVFALGTEATLEDWLDEVRANGRELSFEQVWRAFDRIAQGVSAAHAANEGRGVVHGCLTPGSIAVERRGDNVTDAKVCDIGLAAFDEVGTERLGKLPGFSEYLAPEQIDGASETFATDVFALAVILCELLGGRAPSSPPLWQLARDGGARSFIDRARGDLPVLVRDIVLAALDPFASRRPASASVLHDSLRIVWPGSPPVSSTVMAPALRLDDAPKTASPRPPPAPSAAKPPAPTSASAPPATPRGPTLGPARTSAKAPLFHDPTHPGFVAPIADPTENVSPMLAARAMQRPAPPRVTPAPSRPKPAPLAADDAEETADISSLFPAGAMRPRGGDTDPIGSSYDDVTDDSDSLQAAVNQARLAASAQDDRTVTIDAPPADMDGPPTVAIDVPPDPNAGYSPYAADYPTNLPTLAPPTRNGPSPAMIPPSPMVTAYRPYQPPQPPRPSAPRVTPPEPMIPAIRWSIVATGALAVIGLGVLLAVWIGSH